MGAARRHPGKVLEAGPGADRSVDREESAVGGWSRPRTAEGPIVGIEPRQVAPATTTPQVVFPGKGETWRPSWSAPGSNHCLGR